MADEDVPPLEDMSDLLAQVEALRESKSTRPSKDTSYLSKISSTSISPCTEHSSPSSSKVSMLTSPSKISTSLSSAPSAVLSSSCPSSVTSKKENTGMFGFKKGFLLNNGPSKTKIKQKTEKNIDNKDDIPFIKKKDKSEGDELKIPEVQQMLSNAEKLTKDKDAWVTDDLLKKIENNGDLLKKFGERKYAEAIEMFQRNPQQALEKYKQDMEVQLFFKEFCGIMGEHFSKLAEKNEQSQPSTEKQSKIVELDGYKTDKADSKRVPFPQSKLALLTKSPEEGADISVQSSTNPNQPTAADEMRMKEILANPEIREILMDPKVFGMIEALRSNPAEGQRMFSVADNDTKKKLQKLVQCGLLQFQV